eukprot:1162093-Pelagomonas_calceolata.AAC.12
MCLWAWVPSSCPALPRPQQLPYLENPASTMYAFLFMISVKDWGARQYSVIKGSWCCRTSLLLWPHCTLKMRNLRAESRSQRKCFETVPVCAGRALPISLYQFKGNCWHDLEA